MKIKLRFPLVTAIICMVPSIAHSQGASKRFEFFEGQVYDTSTDLTWTRCSIGQTWKGQLGCVGVVQTMRVQEVIERGPAGFHIPSVREVRTLFDKSHGANDYDRVAFPVMDARDWYWTYPDHDTSYCEFDFSSLGKLCERDFSGRDDHRAAAILVHEGRPYGTAGAATGPPRGMSYEEFVGGAKTVGGTAPAVKKKGMSYDEYIRGNDNR